MRVAFPSNRYLDPRTPRAWSGLPYFIRRTLEDAGIETVVAPLAETGRAGRWLRFLAWRILRRRRYLRGCEPALLRHYARELERQLSAFRVDAVFSTSSWFCSCLETRLPVFFWTDASFAGLVDFYPSFTRLAPPSLRAGHAAEQGALDRCTRGFYCSDWAARTALENYRVDPAKLAVIPFGGNLQEPPDDRTVSAAIAARGPGPCRLLLVGVEWARKGASIAVDAVEALRARGLDARLTIIGCRPPAGVRLPESVELVPFIGKETPEGRRRLNDYYLRSHFFIMPTRAEAYGLVFSEAGAFGVPCLATQVGGLPSVIRDDVNGRLFDPASSGALYADYIAAVLREPGRYQAMALRSAAEARERLSWEPAGRKLAALMAEAMAPAAVVPA